MSRFSWLLIAAVSFAVHLPGLTSPFLDYHAHRQCQTASMARNYWAHGMHFWTPELDTNGWPARAGTEFPIYSWLLAVLYKLFGFHEVLARLLSSACAAGGALYLYAFSRRRWGEPTALSASLVLCVLPLHVYFTRAVQPEPMALFGLLGFFYHLERWLEKPALRHWILALLVGSLAPLLKLNFVYLLLPMALYLGWEAWREKRLLLLPYAVLLGGLLLLPAAWYDYAKSAPTSILPLTHQEHIDNIKAIFSLSLWRKQFLSWIPEVVLTYSGLFLAVIGWRRAAASKRLLIFWTLTSALYVVLLGKYGVIHRYTLLPLTPLAAVLIALGIQTAWAWAKDVQGRRVLVGILVLGIPLHMLFRIQHWYRLERTWLLSDRAQLQALIPANELLLVNTLESPVHLYYLERYGYSLSLGVNGEGWKELEHYRAQGVRYFLTPTEGHWSTHPEWEKQLAPAKLLLAQPDFRLYRLGPFDD